MSSFSTFVSPASHRSVLPHVREGERVMVLCILVPTRTQTEQGKAGHPGMTGEAVTLIRITAFSKIPAGVDRQKQIGPL